MTLEIQPVSVRKDLGLEFPMVLKQMTEQEAKEYHRNRRKQIILDYAKRQKQKQRSVTQKEKDKDFEEIDEFQTWIEARINEPAKSWERWDGMIEEWEPWDRFGNPVNRWRRYYKSR
jgi:hypothetical protein